MKKMVNFRLSTQSINLLCLLEHKLHCAKTAVIENALQFYAKKELHTKSPLLKYAGILKEQDADEILTNIKESKHNKIITIKL